MLGEEMNNQYCCDDYEENMPIEAQNDLISIVIPVYNAEEHLEVCIDSILKQSYKNFEIIMINDGSVDGSLDVGRRLMERDRRVMMYTQENSGPSAARNYGIRRANGDYLVFSDADDWMDRDALRKLHEAMVRYNVELAIGSYARFQDGNSYDDSRHRISKYSAVIMRSNRELASLFLKPETSLLGVSIWGKMYKMDIIRENNVEFPEDINYEEDCCFNLQYFRHVNTTAILRDILYHYRQTGESLSKKYNPKGFGYLVNGFNERCRFLEDIGLESKIDHLKTVFALVILSTFKKIARADLTRKERIEEYNRVMGFPEVKEVVRTVKSFKKPLSRKLIDATRENNAFKVASILEVWKIYNEFKQKYGKSRIFDILRIVRKYIFKK